MGNCVVCCDAENPHVMRGDDLELGQIPCPVGVHLIKVCEVECHIGALLTTALSQSSSDEEAEFEGEVVIESQECGFPALHDVQETAHVSRGEQNVESIRTVEPPITEWGSWGSYVSPLHVSNYMQGRVCNLCHGTLSGALTLGVCGHIFHDRCTWKHDVCPCCQVLIDEPMERLLDTSGAPVMPNGTPVMLQGLMIQRGMNGTYGHVVDYSTELGRYTIRQKTSRVLYKVKSKNVVNIMLE